MEESPSNIAKFREKSKEMLGTKEKKYPENVDAKRQKPTVDKVMDSKIYKDIIKGPVNKQSNDSKTVITRCTDEEHDLLVESSCRGILVHSKEWEIKDKAIEITTRLLPSLANIEYDSKKKEFCTKNEMNRYEEQLKSTGFGLDISLDFEDIKIGTSHSKEDNSKHDADILTDNVFFAIVDYHYVKTMSLQLSQTQLRLAPLALEEIQKLQKLISKMGYRNRAVKDACCQFIDTFGSHVSIGSVDIGGILKTSTIYDSTTQMTEKKCKDFAKQEHAAYINLMKIANLEASLKIENEQKKETIYIREDTKLQHACSQINYPLNVCNSEEWKKKLINNPGAWCIIRRGSTTGIWNILLNHKDEIRECATIASMIRNAWQETWGQCQIDRLDKVVCVDIESLLENIDRSKIEEIIVKLTMAASLNSRFKEYFPVTKCIPFFRNAVSKRNELQLKYKVHLKVLLGFIDNLKYIEDNEDILNWFLSPLFSCEESVYEYTLRFLTSDLYPIYIDLSFQAKEKHWMIQVNRQIQTEIAYIIKHNCYSLNDEKQCIMFARCAVKLGFDFENMQTTDQQRHKSVEDFFLAVSQENAKSSLTPFLQFKQKIERDFFQALQVSKSISQKCNEQQVYKAFQNDFSDICENCFENAINQRDLETVLLLATLGFDIELRKFRTDQNLLLPSVEKTFQRYAVVWNAGRSDTFSEVVSCYDVISALSSVFVETVEKLEKGFPEFLVKAYLFYNRLRSNICAQLQDTQKEIVNQEECILLEIIISKALQNMENGNIACLESSDDLRILIEDMATSLHKFSKQISLYSRKIPCDQKVFVKFLKECFLSLWQTSRSQLINRCQPDAVRAVKVLDEFFKRELERLCRSSLNMCTTTELVDIRSKILQNICYQSEVNCKAVERFVDIHYSVIKMYLYRFLRFVYLLAEKIDNFIKSLTSSNLDAREGFLS